MSDLLTRLAERALGRAAPPLEPRLPSRYADAPAGASDAFFSEVSAEVDAPSPFSPAPRPPRAGPAAAPAPPRQDAAPAPTPSPHHPSPFHAPAPADVDAHPSAPPPAHASTEPSADRPAAAARLPETPAITVARTVVAREADPPRGEDVPTPPSSPEPNARAHASSPAHPEPVRGESVSHHPAAMETRTPVDREDEGFREVDAFVPAERRGAAVDPPLSPSAPHRSLAVGTRRAGTVDERRETGGDPSSASPPRTDAGDPVDAGGPRPAAAVVEARAAQRGGLEPAVADEDGGDGLREVVTVVERGGTASTPRREVRTPTVGTRVASAPAAEAREGAEEQRPVIRVTIGRIEVRAAPQPAAPAPAARKGWTPPVTPLDEYLKREPGR
jgi:hypothetical protein